MPPAMMELLKNYASQITEAEQSGDDAEQDDTAKKELGSKELKLVVFNNNITIVTEKTFVASDFPYVFNSREHKSKNGIA